MIVVEGRRRGGWFWFFGQTRKLKIADKNMKKSETPAVAAHILDQVDMLLLQSKKSWKNAGKIQRPLLHYCILVYVYEYQKSKSHQNLGR